MNICTNFFFFFNLDRELHISLHHSSPYIPFIPSVENQTPALLISIDASEHPRLSFTVVGSHLHRQHSKIQPEIELLSLPTHHSKIQVRISLSPSLSMGFGAKSEEFLKLRSLFFGFCFLFLFFLTNRENPFFLFFVCCWDGALIYNPNIDALHSRNLEGFSLLLLLLNQLHQQPMRFVIFLYTLFGCRESVGR